jgi:hypothetical protein
MSKELPPWGAVCGLTMSRIQAYIYDFNRHHIHDLNGHGEAMTKRQWGIAVDDFVFVPDQKSLFDNWRESTPYGYIVTAGDTGVKRFEPATGFDLASQDWPPTRL